MKNHFPVSPRSEFPAPDSSSEPSVPAPASGPLDHLNEMERIRAIGELSEYKTALDSFRRRELERYSPAAIPPGREELAKRWEREGIPRPSHPEVRQLAALTLQDELYGTDIAMRQSHELSTIDMARTSWSARLQESRQTGDDESALRWEQMGKGVFFPDSEEERQRLVSQRYEFLNRFNKVLAEAPHQALSLLEEEGGQTSLPSTVKEYLKSRARQSVSDRQGRFYRSLLDNELQGTPLQRDAVEEAVRKSYLTPEQARLHLKRLEESRPLKNEETIRLPLLNTTLDLIDSYIPQNDPRGERKRSILGLIAACDEDREEKNALLRRLEQQEANPDLAQARKECGQYLKDLYDKTGLGACHAAVSSAGESGLSREAWLNAQRKLRAARKAVDDFLGSGRFSPEDRERELPRKVYKAVREERHVDFSSLLNGYPVFLSSSPEGGELSQEKAGERAAAPGVWSDRLNSYFSSAGSKSLKETDREISELFHAWLQGEESEVILS